MLKTKKSWKLMTEISNRTLGILTLIAVFVTFVGAFMSLAKTGSLQVPFITGFAASVTGIVNVTVSGLVSISLPTNKVEFGNGSLVSSPSHTIVNSSATTNPSTFSEPGPLRVRNDGNVLVNITINGTTPATFLGGTSPSYMWAGLTGESGCLGNLSTSLANFSVSHVGICDQLNFSDATDELNLSIYLAIPSDAVTGLKQDTLVEFKAAQCPGC